MPLSSIAPFYNAILFTYGASLSNPLASVPGSSASPHPLEGVFPALAFVGWYNGHPAFADLCPDLTGVESVDVVGQGNVALDVARILLSPVESLAASDLPQSVLDTLARSTVQKVRAVGRRGPAQVAFTTKELREMVRLPGVDFPGVDDALMAEAKAMAKGDRARTRMLGLMEKPVHGGTKRFELAFLRSPTAFLPSGEGRVAEVEYALNELVESERGVSARATDKREVARAEMVVESVGYRSEPIAGGALAAPFDDARGRLFNSAGRVHDAETGRHVPGAYAAGWVARGPVGVIASTMQDAYGLVDTVLDDYARWGERGDGPIPLVPEDGRPEAIEAGLREGKVVDIPRWLRIDAAEKERGVRSGRAEREKFTRVEEMLDVLG